MLGSAKDIYRQYSMNSIASSSLYPKYPEDPIPANYMDKVLDLLEDYSLNTYLIRCQNYQTIECMLKNKSKVNIALLRRLLTVCIHDINEGTKYTVVILNITTWIFKQNIKDWSSLPELVPLASGLLNVLKKSTLTLSNMKHLQLLCLDKLSLYPDEVLKNIPTSDMIELVNYTLQSGTGNKSLAYNLVCKFIKALPPDNRVTFIEEHLALWFLKLLPQVMTVVVCKEYSADPILNLLETVTDTLLKIDYSDNDAWAEAFEHICTPNKYPSVLMQLLEFDNDSWLRLSIVLIKLLKQNMTSCKTKGVSPINAILPVLETAFKMDTDKRCQAFKCWKVLIDSFSKDNSQAQIIKGIKLFIIPLKSNNAKVIETALAKFDTWWYMIKKYSKLIPDITDILKPFITFCFGIRCDNKEIMVPGFMSDELKKLCVQAFVEITGHVDCQGCVSKSFTRLEGKLLTGQFLNQYLSVWINALKQTILISVSLDDVEVQTQMKCAWKSILAQTQLLQSEDGEKVYNAILDMVLEIIAEQELVAKLVYDFFLTSMLNDDGFKTCLAKTDNDMHFGKRVVKLVLDPALNNYCKQCNAENVVNNLMPLTKIIVCNYFINNKELLTWLLAQLGDNDCSLLMWTALIKSTTIGKLDIGVKLLRKMMLWPLSRMESFVNYQFPASVWNSIYETSKPKFTKPAFHNAILNVLSTNQNQHNLFYLFAFMQILKHSLDSGNDESYKIEISLLLKIFENIDTSKIVECIFPLIIKVIMSMICNYKIVNKSEYTFKLQDSVYKLLRRALNSNIVDNGQFALHYFSLLESLIHFLYTSSITHVTVPSFVTQSVTKCAELLTDQSPKIDEIYKLLKKLLNKIEISDKYYRELKRIIETRIDRTESNISLFSAPNMTLKKAKKKEASIVNTVVENGEEFVVVKSNWKFNPRKLTENQKEKFQRKREDIPALYQDLSQSQEGFKLSTWKTDSQDTTTGSKSTSKEGSVDFTNVLKNMPNTEVVPKIMENILESANSPKTTKNTDNNEKIDSPSINSPSSVKRKKDIATPREHKSPRIALKDRISHNVKSLIEKCSVFNNNDKKQIKITEPTIVTKTILSDENSENNKNIVSTSPFTSAMPLDAMTKMEIDNITEQKVNSEDVLQQNKDPKSSSKNKINDLTTPTPIKKKRARKSKSHATPTTTPTPTKYLCDPTERPPRIRRKPNKFDPDSDDFVRKRLCQTVNSPLKNSETDRQNENSQIIPIISNNNTQIVPDDQNELIPQTKENIVKVLNEANIESSQANENLTQNFFHIHQSENMSEASPEPSKETEKEINGNTDQLPKPDMSSEVKSKTKKKPYKSRLESNLAIDMVEGHPFLKTLDGKRKSRKSDSETIITRNINKCSQNDNTKNINNGLMANEASSSDDIQMSEDFIESSQDSSVTSISSSKICVKKSPKVIVQMLPFVEPMTKTYPSISFTDKTINLLTSNQTKDDIELPVNKTISIDTQDLTAEMDTEPLAEEQSCDDIIIINDNHTTVEISSKNITNKTLQNTADAGTEPVDSQNLISVIANTQPVIEQQSFDDVIKIDDDIPTMVESSSKNNTNETLQNTANADTEPVDGHNFISTITNNESSIGLDSQNTANADTEPMNVTQEIISLSKQNEAQEGNDITTKAVNDGNGLSSPFKDVDQRNVDFLNNTLELSPIKIMSPIDNERSPPRNKLIKESYVVVKLTSPVQCNGEPFEKSSSLEDSPEVFTDDRMPLDKRYQSPPRPTTTGNSSPSTSLSLKKKRPQVRAGGRAAHMLGLCVPDQLIIQKSNEPNEVRTKTVCNAMSAKRNLRIMYACTDNDTEDKSTSSEEDVDFLMIKKSVLSTVSSPSGPILKRKLAEVSDETTVSPASKRKRVSFHDPPVSTTVSVEKYLEPLHVKSPSSAGIKKRTNREQMKSPKKLENFFKVTTAPSKTEECFNSPEDLYNFTDDIESSSLETQSIEVVKTTDLNDTDPICSELMYCTDPISEIATELSSPAMKNLLVNELKGKVESVGDLAKMTELEVNRLQIKAPKIKIARKVLTDYLRKKKVVGDISDRPTLETLDLTSIVEKASEDIQAQNTQSSEVQFKEIHTQAQNTQSSEVQSNEIHTSIEDEPNVESSSFIEQPIESGSNAPEESTDDLVLALLKRPDWTEALFRRLDDNATEKCLDELSLDSITEALARKLVVTTSINDVIQCFMSLQSTVMNVLRTGVDCDEKLLNEFMRNHVKLCSKLIKDSNSSTS